jgi:phage terminase small subunit
MAAKTSQKKPVNSKVDKISDKEQLFCEYYVQLRNATKAAIAAGYAPRSAEVAGSRLLSKDKIKGCVEGLLAKAQKRQEISHDAIISRWMKIADITIEDVATFAATVIGNKKGNPLLVIKPIDQWSEAAREHLWIEQDIKALKVGRDKYQVVPVQKVIPPNKEKALIEIGKLLGFYNDLNTSIECLRRFGLDIKQDDDGQLTASRIEN